MPFETRDSGEREEFPTGSRRDTQTGKPRYDLIGHEGLTRLAGLMERGAAKYGPSNWRLGQPVSRYYASAFRHLIQWASGNRDEDHLSGVVFNIFGIMHIEDTLSKTRPELLDHESYNIAKEAADVDPAD